MLARWPSVFGSLFLAVLVIAASVTVLQATDSTSSSVQSEVSALQIGGGGGVGATPSGGGGSVTPAGEDGDVVDSKPQGDEPAKPDAANVSPVDLGATIGGQPATTVASEVTTTKQGGSATIHSSVVLVTVCGLGAFLKVSA